jgi:Ca-activated chloride channel family protein
MKKSLCRIYNAPFLPPLFSFLFCILFIFSAQAQTADNESGVRLDLPPDDEVLIENVKGSVAVEVWRENYVFVSATPDGVKGRPPVHIERTARGLKIDVLEKDISVTSTKILPATMTASANASAIEDAPVDLQVRVPARARIDIITTSGDVRVHGVTSRLVARTISGNVSIDVPKESNADIFAQSPRGLIASTLGDNASGANDKSLQVKFGNGSEKVLLLSETGRITLAPLQSIAAREDEKSTSVENASNVNGADKNAAKTNETNAEAANNSTSPKPANEATSADAGDDVVNTVTAPPKAPPKLIGVQGQRTRPRKVGDAAQEVGENEVVRVETDLVTLNFGVVDRASNRGITGLRKEDFKLYEDGVEQEIVHFDAASAPFDLVLVLDVSGSTTKVFELVRAAARRFVDVSRPQDRIAIITFSSDMNIVSPLTTNREALRAAIANMKLPKGDTKLYDAVAFSMRMLDEAKDPSRRRAIVLVSDGLDSTLPNVTGTGSKIKYDDLRRAVQESDAQFYSMWVDTTYEAFSPDDIQPETFDLAHDRMKELADAGGGVFYEVDRYEDLAGTCERVIEDLGTIYNLSYRPSNRTKDGSWRAVRVMLPQRPQAIARGKSGYYAR